jgi:hypothetical protein
VTEALLRTGLDDFLTWARDQDETLEPRAADAVLALLALRGARRRADFPEPTPALLRPLLHEDLPAYCVPDDNEGLIDYLHVLTVLMARTREAGLLNAKRQDRLLTEIEKLTPGLLVGAADRTMLSWPRIYGRLMLDEGVPLGDAGRVREWMAAHAALPAGERRRRALEMFASMPDESEEDRVRVAALATQSARLQLSRLVLTAALREARRAVADGDKGDPPLFTAPTGDEDDLAALSDGLAADWVAAGLGSDPSGS